MTPDRGPIVAVVELCDSFTVEEWKHAAYIAADQLVDDVCERMATLRRARPTESEQE